MSNVEFPKVPRASARMVEAQIEDSKQRLEMGVIGRLIGHGTEKPGNVAVFAIFIACIMMAFIAWVPISEPSFPRREILLALVQVIPTALGFLFGKAK